MSKLVFSHKNIMSIFLFRILGIRIDNFKIINKRNNKEISPDEILFYLKQELSTSCVHTKRKRVDLLVKTDNEIINLEINNTFNEEVRRRNFSYMANIYSNYLRHKDKYADLPKFIQINICNNIREPYDFDNHFVFGERCNNKLVDNINFLVINVARYKNLLYTNSECLIKKICT